MKYLPPIHEGKEQFVPVVCKNVDQLIGFLRGSASMGDSIMPHASMCISELLDISSSRFNDIMDDGRRESSLSIQELQEYLVSIVERCDVLVDSYETDKFENDDVLRVSCGCGLGYYSWADYKSLPSETTKCDVCGRVIIHYTGHDDCEYTFDEAISKRCVI